MKETAICLVIPRNKTSLHLPGGRGAGVGGWGWARWPFYIMRPLVTLNLRAGKFEKTIGLKRCSDN